MPYINVTMRACLYLSNKLYLDKHFAQKTICVTSWLRLYL